MLCLNAGIVRWGSVLDMDVGDFDDQMRVNVRGTFLGLQAFAPALIEAGGGSIVITSSGLGLQGAAYRRGVQRHQARPARPDEVGSWRSRAVPGYA